MKEKFSTYFFYNLNKSKIISITISISTILTLLISQKFFLSNRDYPTVSMFSFEFSTLDTIFYYSCLTFLVVSLFSRVGYLFFSISFILLLINDQSRMQPYYILFFWSSLSLGLLGEKDSYEKAFAPIRLILIATYFWAGIAKINPGYPDNGFLVLFSPFKFIIQNIFGAGRYFHTLAFCTAVIETMMAIGLILKKTRQVTVVLILSLHLLILIILGPFGQNVAQVVWPWNISMIILVYFLFFDFQKKIEITSHSKVFSTFVLAIICIAPALNRYELWDDYLSFHAYSGGTYDAFMYIHPNDVPKLSKSMKQSLVANKFLYFYTWASKEYKTSAYPSPRIYKSIAKKICSKKGLSHLSELTLLYKPQWPDGKRTEKKWSCKDIHL